MTRHDITLDPSDLDTIASGTTVSVPTDQGLTFEVTSEDSWTRSTDPAVCRFGLSRRQLDRLRWGRTVTVLPVGFDGSVQFRVDAAVTA